jgi:hypothetical protein
MILRRSAASEITAPQLQPDADVDDLAAGILEDRWRCRVYPLSRWL